MFVYGFTFSHSNLIVMKDTVNIPYGYEQVSLKPKNKASSDEHYNYTVQVPDWFLSEKKFKNNRTNLEFVAEVNCSATFYRKCIRLEGNPLQIKVPKSKVKYKFRIDVLVIARKQILWGQTSINKGMPIIHFGSSTIDIDARSDGLIKFTGHDADKISIDNTSHTIYIKLPQNQFSYINRRKSEPLMRNILASQFGQIALLECCKDLNDESDKSHLAWFKELKFRWKRYCENEKDGGDYPEPEDHLSFVSYLLEEPSIKLLESYKNEYDQSDE